MDRGGGPARGQPLLGSSLLLVFLQKLVCITQDDLPLTALSDSTPAERARG